MRAINYLKLDIRIMRGTLKYLVLVPLVFIFLTLKDSSAMGLGYLFFFLIIIAATPFTVESNEKCDKMYYMLPSKISSMVLGRFLYLISTILIVWIIDGSVMMYLYNTNTLSALEAIAICLSGAVATIVCFCQYPIYYKFGIEKGKILSALLYTVPAFIIFALPSVLSSSSILTPQFLDRVLALTMSNKISLSLLVVVIISIIGIVSYLFSCSICQRKEI
ncbi:hypothetical protein CPJCM30710_26370 [Clostridium polyendosporum]|uniref:ABC-2 family transporter protein n=2 Tax=Clostridium polyendosporum TaxID=69208 RepID=A0A919VHR2_9CLOT|nr:hypothetical protein CPJCM30710_26370 [Clostridium polyendosporum]